MRIARVRSGGKGVRSLMSMQPSIIERAFQLAKSGRYPTVGDIRKQLDHEKIRERGQLCPGRALIAQLRSLIAAARAKPLD